MARTLKPLSMSFSEEMIARIEARAFSLGLSRSAYLRQLVNQDLEEAGNTPSKKGKQSFPERFRELENTVATLQKQLASLQLIEGYLESELQPTGKKKSTKKTLGQSSTPSPIDVTREPRDMTVLGDEADDSPG